MAIAHDATTNATPISDAASMTFSHTVSGTDRLLVVKVGKRGAAGVTVTVTYGGASMTQQISQTGPNFQEVLIFTLIAPATGANNVVVTFSASVNQGFASASSYTGVDQTTPMDAAATGTSGTSATASHSITTVTDNAWVVDNVIVDALSITMTAATGRTERTNQTNNQTFGTSDRGPISPAGSVTMDWTFTSADWTIALAALRPAVSGRIFKLAGYGGGLVGESRGLA